MSCSVVKSLSERQVYENEEVDLRVPSATPATTLGMVASDGIIGDWW